MNYRHAYHAGNAADVLKHAVLCACLAYLNAKDKPWRLIDTHAGSGLYDLTSDAAMRTGEHVEGIARLLASPLPDDLSWMRPYTQAVEEMNGGTALRLYPGSPALARAFARRDDRLALCELHPAEQTALEENFGRDRRVKLIPHSGWNAPKAFCPPPEKRGLVFIDPPFEEKGEFHRMWDAMNTVRQRWPGGMMLLWYPIKESGEHEAFTRAVLDDGDDKTIVAELTTKRPGTKGLLGSGLVMLNPPYQLAEAMAHGADSLAARLHAPPGALTLRAAA